jgi:ATP-dependent DNA helicase PIF1
MTYVGRDFSADLVVEPTKLYPTRNKVELINLDRMSSLQGAETEYKLKYIKDHDVTKAEREIRRQYNDQDIQIELEFLASNLMCEKVIKMKLGAHVMCILNIKTEDGEDVLICNGSQGIVTDFCEYTKCPKVKFNNGVEMIMAAHVWTSDKIPGIAVSQVPLILSWALTIHKCQGITLDTAEIDAGSGIFECGQTYVSLSRVKNLHGLYLTSFDVTKIKINKKVKEYYDALRLYYETKELEPDQAAKAAADIIVENIPTKMDNNIKTIVFK